jgi:hypothetical protein
MLAEMSNAATLTWIFVAFLIHAVVFGATSMNYLRATFLPKTAQSQPAEADATPAVPAPLPPAAPKAAAADAKTPEPADEAKLLEAHKDSPVVKAITEPAKPSELPKGPSHNGLDLEGLENK